MKFVITGGGTGGHIYPALSIADALKKEFPNLEIVYIGTATGLEKDVVPKAGYQIKFIKSQGFNRKLSFTNIKAVFKSLVGVGQAIKIIRKVKPDLVIGTGGFVSGPVMLAAILLRIPTLVHEQNVYPGLTNRLIAKYVHRIAVSFQDSEKYLPREKLILTGNPVRKMIWSQKRETGFKNLKLDAAKKTIFIFGGSGGAKSLNRAMLGFYSYVEKKPDLQLIHVTGKRDFADQKNEIKKAGLQLGGRIRVEKYLYQIEDAYSVADLIICRSGAITLSELTARGIGSILVPFPHATDNHQEYNARSLERAGAAKIILDWDLSADRLCQSVDQLFKTPSKLEKMKKASAKLGIRDADQRIIKVIKEILKE